MSVVLDTIDTYEGSPPDYVQFYLDLMATFPEFLNNTLTPEKLAGAYAWARGNSFHFIEAGKHQFAPHPFVPHAPYREELVTYAVIRMTGAERKVFRGLISLYLQRWKRLPVLNTDHPSYVPFLTQGADMPSKMRVSDAFAETGRR